MLNLICEIFLVSWKWFLHFFLISYFVYILVMIIYSFVIFYFNVEYLQIS